MARPRTFRTDPALAWGFYGHRLALYRRTQPHAGFGLLERWADTLRHGAWVERRSAFQLNGLSRWVAEVERPLVIEIGAGTAVPSVRHFSEQLGLVHGARLVRINPHEPQVPRAHDVSLPLGALEALQALDTRWSARVQQTRSDA